MGFATHLGPWLLGTVKNTTGTTAGTIRNTGATVVAQTVPFTFTNVNAALTGTAGAIPAGALITRVSIITSTVFSAATTLKVTIAGTDVATASTITNADVYPVTMATTFAPIAANVGSTDALVTYTFTKGSTLTTGAATLVIEYVVRDSSGNAAQPANQQ